MKAISVRTKSGRISREDGDATRKRIIDVAGQLCADKGYADTTCKEICEKSKTNIAAVNYHFGSREGLYFALLEEVQQALFEPLDQILKSDSTPAEKLEKFISTMLGPIFEQQGWRVRVWAREIVSPTPIRLEMDRERWLGKFRIVTALITEYTGIPENHELIPYCKLAIMSPFMVLLIVGPHKGPHQAVFERGLALATENLTQFVLAGLDSLAAKYAATKKNSG